MATSIALINQKGGVGKTTSTTNLAYALARRGKRVLAVDCDPQASLTIYSGHDPRALEASEKTLYYALLRDVAPASLVLGGTYDLIPSSIVLAGAEAELTASSFAGPHLLKNLLGEVAGGYDYVLLDCPPSLGRLTVNALSAADYVLVPVKTDNLSMMGIPYLLDSIRETRRRANKNLEILGVLPTMYNPGYKHDGAALDALQASMEKRGIPVFAPINRSTGYDKATTKGKPTLEIAPDTPGARNYYALADTLIDHAEQ